MTPAKEFDFAARLKELEAITTWFESDDIDLDAGLTKFEKGMELVTELRTHLKSVENRVEKIKEKFTDSQSSDSVVPPPQTEEPELF